MATKIYLIPRRNDLAGAGLYLKDLKPIAGQKNSIYDGEHQDFYLRNTYDVPGTTTTVGGAYSSGSLNTLPIGALVLQDANNGMANNVQTTSATLPEFGLAAYFRERVTNGAVLCMPPTVAARAAQEVMHRVFDGTALDTTGIQFALNTAATDIGGFAATCVLSTGGSFGTVEEVLQIAAGEAYITPANTIVGIPAGVAFIGEAARDVLVAAAIAAGNTQFVSKGHFLAADESGYRPSLPLAKTTELLNSLMVHGGQLHHYNGTAYEVLNVNNYAYTAADTDTWHPRAQAIGATGAHAAIADTGVSLVLRVYQSDGTCLVPVI